MQKANLPTYGSDVIADILKKHNIHYVSFNPGASFRGIHDSIANDKSNKLDIIMSLHEEIAVAIAHGYAKKTNTPMAVLLHGNVGLQHASMAIFNAWCDRVPMLLFGANGPSDITKRRPWIDWVHNTNSQSSIIQGYVKWFDAPVGIESLKDAMYRGIKIATTTPQAPVYIEIDAALQEEETVMPELEDTTRYLPSKPSPGNLEELEKISTLLKNAVFPLIITDYTGRDPEATKYLQKIAEKLGIGVLDCGSRFNFPSKHYLNITGKDKSILKECDFILALDVKDLYGALGTTKKDRSYVSYLNPKAKIAHITLSDYLIDTWSSDYQKLMPLDISLAADTSAALPYLYNKLSEEKLGKEQQAHILNRQEKLKSLDTMYRAEVDTAIAQSEKKTYLDLPMTLQEVWNEVKKYEWVITNNGNSVIANWLKKIWDIKQPGSYFGGSAGVGLGYGIGASIGMSLASKDQNTLCVDIQPDGDFLYTPQGLWTAVHHNIPLLVIVMNNRTYYNSERHAVEMADQRKRTPADITTGIKIDSPIVNFAQLAESLGAVGMGPITDRNSLQSALKKATKEVLQHKKVVVMDVVFQND